jgi:hypothetical protein
MRSHTDHSAGRARLRTRTVVLSSVVAVCLPASVVALGGPAAAAPPESPVFSDAAARTFGEGGPVGLTPVQSTSIAAAPDGSLLFYDMQAHQIRRVDATDTTVSVLAGSGQVAAGGIDTTDSGSQVDLPPVKQVWTDAAGDVFAWTCVGINCRTSQDLDELDAATERWTVRVTNPRTPNGIYHYEGFAVQPDGDVLAADTSDDVVRSFDVGDPASGATVVAGIAGNGESPASGVTGVATQIPISPTGPIVSVTGGGFDFVEGGRHVGRVEPDGTLTFLPDAGADPTDPGLRWSINSLAVSSDGSTVYEGLNDAYQSEVEAQPVSAGTSITVVDAEGGAAGPIAYLPGRESSGPLLLAANGAVQGWPADGSRPGAAQPYAGIESDGPGFQSPDGTRLDQAYSLFGALAVSPTGSIALATDDGIRRVSGLSASSVLGTIAPDVQADDLAYADDGSLYALVPNPAPHIVRIDSNGNATTVAGGGTLAPAGGIDAHQVRFYDDPGFAVDPQTRTVYFTDPQDKNVWAVDPVTGVVSALAQLPSAVSFSAAALAVDINHDVLADASYNGDPRPLTRIAANGDESAGGCLDGPRNRMTVLPDGTLIGENNGSTEICAPDGTDHRLGTASTLSTYAVTGDGRLLRSGGYVSGGLLQVSNPITPPSSVDIPSAQVNPIPGGASVTITPAAVADQRIRIIAGQIGPSGTWTHTTVVDDTTVDGTGQTYTHTFDHLLRVWPNRAGATGPTWQFEVVASEGDQSAGDGMTDAPIVLHQQLAIDPTPPAAPRLTLTNHGTTVTLTVTPPSDADLDRVVICRSTTGPVTDPHACTEDGELSSPADYSASNTATVDPLANTTFTAFAVDDSGNVSAGTSATRTAATLATGLAATAIGYGPTTGGEQIIWRTGGSAGARYTTGTTAPPANPDAGNSPSQFYFGGAGQIDTIPLSSGAKANVSLFDWTNASMTAYRRSSFTVTQGSTSDTITTATTPTVSPGTRPTVTVTVNRRSPTSGAAPLSAVRVTLFRRPVGTAAWQQVGYGTTSTAGTITMRVPVPTAATDYQAQFWTDTVPSKLLTSPTVRTSIRQLITATAPTRVHAGAALTVTGTLTPHRSATIVLQRLVGRTWRTIATTHCTATGNYRLAYKPARGRTSYHVTVAATPALLAATSRIVNITVG